LAEGDASGADDGAGLEVGLLIGLEVHVPHENGHFAEWAGQRLAIRIGAFLMFALM